MARFQKSDIVFEGQRKIVGATNHIRRPACYYSRTEGLAQLLKVSAASPRGREPLFQGQSEQMNGACWIGGGASVKPSYRTMCRNQQTAMVPTEGAEKTSAGVKLYPLDPAGSLLVPLFIAKRWVFVTV